MRRFYQGIYILFLATLLLFPYQLNPYINALIFGFSSLLLPLIFLMIKEEKIGFSYLNLSILTFLLVVLSSTLFSSYFDLSLQGLLLYVCYFSIFLTSGFIFNTNQSRKVVFILLITTSSVLSLVSLYNTFFLGYRDVSRYGVSFYWIYYGHNHLANIILLVLPIIWFFIFENGKKVFRRNLYIGLFIFFSVVLYFCFSRAALIIWPFQIGLLLIASKFKSSQIRFSAKGLLSLFLVIPIGLLLVFSYAFLTGPISMARIKTFPSTRVIYIKEGISNFLNSPIIGNGINSFSKISFKNVPKRITRADHPHNLIIQILSDMGFLGLITGSSVLILLFLEIKNRLKKLETRFVSFCLMVSIFSIFLYSMMDIAFYLPTVSVLTAFLLGLLIQKESNS